MNESRAVVQTADKPTKMKTRYIVVHEYKGDLSIQTAFQEVIEHKVCYKFEQWKDEKPIE